MNRKINLKEILQQPKWIFHQFYYTNPAWDHCVHNDYMCL